MTVKAETEIIRVASYNIRKCVGLDWRRDPERVLSVISALDADILALQEADKRLGDRPATLPPSLIGDLTDMVPVVLGVDQPSLGFHGNAILVRKGIEVAATAQLELPGLEPRGAVLVELKRADFLVRIVGVHLGLTRNFRRQQLQKIVDEVQARAQMPTVILGDFNEWSHRRGTEALTDMFDVVRPGLSFHTAQPIAALDRIAISKAFAVRNKGVFSDGAAARASDHLPVWADLSLG